MKRRFLPLLLGLFAVVALAATGAALRPQPARSTLLPANGDLVVSKRMCYPSTGCMENVRELFRVDLDSTTPDVRLTFQDGADNGGTFSPDGEQFAWSFYPDNQYLGYGNDILVMDLDNPATMANVTGPYDPFDRHWESSPDWSPDGTKLAIVTADFYWMPTPPYSPDNQIALYDFTTHAITDVVPDSDPTVLEQMDHPSWSPDGTKIAYMRGVLGNEMSWDIYLYDVATGASTQIALAGAQNYPDWSPDGTRLVVHTKATASDDWDIATVEVATGVMTPLVTSPFDDIQPAWSPDGTKIAYTSPKATGTNGGFSSDVYVLDLGTGNEQRVTTDGEMYQRSNGSPVWRPVPRHYGVTAFSTPVDTGATNVAKAGRTIPVRWQVLLDGVAVSDPSHFVGVFSHVVLPAGTPPADDEIEVYAGSSGLQYVGDGWWQFNWKTPTSYKGQSRVMTLRLDDGSEYVAYFDFR